MEDGHRKSTAAHSRIQGAQVGAGLEEAVGSAFSKSSSAS